MAFFVHVRPAETSDLNNIHALAAQLGYPDELSAFKERFCLILKDPVQCILIEIRALVVDEKARGRGIGKRLILEAEKFAHSEGADKVRFVSNIKRERAHRLYQELGYDVYKTSYNFIKKLK